MRPKMVNRGLILLAVAVLLGVFRVYAPPAYATPLLGLAAILGVAGSLAMWLGLTLRTREELERLPEEASRMETSSGVFELTLIIVLLVTLAAIGAMLMAVPLP